MEKHIMIILQKSLHDVHFQAIQIINFLHIYTLHISIETHQVLEIHHRV